MFNASNEGPAIGGKLEWEQWEEGRGRKEEWASWQITKSTIDHVICWGWAQITLKIYGQTCVTGPRARSVINDSSSTVRSPRIRSPVRVLSSESSEYAMPTHSSDFFKSIVVPSTASSLQHPLQHRLSHLLLIFISGKIVLTGAEVIFSFFFSFFSHWRRVKNIYATRFQSRLLQIGQKDNVNHGRLQVQTGSSKSRKEPRWLSRDGWVCSSSGRWCPQPWF